MLNPEKLPANYEIIKIYVEPGGIGAYCFFVAENIPHYGRLEKY